MAERKKKNKALIIVLVIVAIVLMGFIGYEFFMVENITITGNTKYTDEDIVKLAAIPQDTHMLFVDEELIAKNIEYNPYIIVEDVKRVFPNSVEITVAEADEYSYCTFAGQTVLLSYDFKVLEDNSAIKPNDAIELFGLNVVSAEKCKTIEIEEPYKLDVASEIFANAEAQGIIDNIMKVDLRDVNSIKLYLASGYTIKFGQGDSYEEKMSWIDLMTKRLASENIVSGEIDVSSGAFATYSE